MIYIRLILRILGVALALIWSFAIKAAFHSGSGLQGAGDGAGYGSSAAGSDAVFLSIVWLIPMVPIGFIIFGPRWLHVGDFAAAIRWYANIVMGLFILLLLMLTVKWKWVEFILVVSFVGLWNFYVIKNRPQVKDA